MRRVSCGAACRSSAGAYSPVSVGVKNRLIALPLRRFQRFQESVDARQHKFAPRKGVAVVEVAQREEGCPGYVSAARLDLRVDGISLAGVKAAGHLHLRENVVEAGAVLSQREIRFKVCPQKPLSALGRLRAKHFLHACDERSAALLYPSLNHLPESPHAAGVWMLPSNHQSAKSLLGIFRDPKA